MLSRFHKSAVTTLVLVSLATTALPSYLQAQNSVSTGIVTGRVEDPSGSFIPGADVVITSPENGYNKASTSDKDGLFSFAALPPGAYTLAASANGFKAVRVSNVNALTGQTTSVPIKMEVGEVTQQVQVTAEADVLNTSDSTVSSVVSKDMIQNLPSLRRNFTDFTLLSPAVTSDGQFGSVSFGGTQGDYTSNYAHGNGSVAFSVDGANATSRWSSEQRMQTRPPYLFGAESVQEFQVSTSPFSPAYGGGTGYINTVTKSGTNAFHGFAFYFNRNTGTGATDAVSKFNGYPRALDVRQQFGAGLGGPIVKNKLFFFFDYEQQRRKNPISLINTAQAALTERDFGLPAGTALPAPTGYPFASSLRAATPGNPIYLQQVSNALFAIKSNLGFYPRRHDDLLFFGRIDYTATSKDQIAMRYNYNLFKATATTTSNPVSNLGYTAHRMEREPDHDMLVHWTHVFNPTVLMDTNLFYSRNEDRQGAVNAVPAGFIPSVSLRAPSALTIGNGAPTNVKEYEWGGGEHITWVKGRHTLDFGVDITHDANVNDTYTGFNGTYTFTSPTSFALGQYSLYNQSSGNPIRRIGFYTFGSYIGDTYRVNPKLTLNLGLRHDGQIYPQPTLNPLFPLTGQFPNDYNRWSPRVGFAYHAAPRTVIRGGIGIFRPFLASKNYLDATTSNGIASLRSSLSLNYNTALSPDTQQLVFPNILPGTSPLYTASPNLNVVDPGFKNTSTIQSSLAIEQQFTSSLTVTLGSIWTHSSHLVSSSYSDLNLIRPTGTTQYIVCPEGATVVPCAGGGSPITLMNLDSATLRGGALYPTVNQIQALVSPGNSDYISGFTQIRQNLRRGFSANVTYTLSRNNASNGFNFNNQWDYSNTAGPNLLDQRHKLTIGFVYQSQYAGTGMSKALLSNWMISTLTQYGSGRPYAGILSPACVGTALASCTGGSNLNNSAFNYGNGIAGGGPSPNIPLNSFYGPWSGGVDLTLERQFKVGEYGKLMFRVTGFNLLNHANYNVYSGNGVNQQQYRPVGPACGNRAENQTCYLIPNNTVGGFGTFSQVQQHSGARIFQFALSYRF